MPPLPRAPQSPLPELALQYADYALWQRSWLDGEAIERQLGYWRERLADAPPVLELPTDRPRPAEPSGRGGEVPFAVPAALRRTAPGAGPLGRGDALHGAARRLPGGAVALERAG
jgi:hypothetical protein